MRRTADGSRSRRGDVVENARHFATKDVGAAQAQVQDASCATSSLVIVAPSSCVRGMAVGGPLSKASPRFELGLSACRLQLRVALHVSAAVPART